MRKSGKEEEERNLFKISTRRRKDYVVINDHWFFDLFEIHYKQSTCQLLSGLRHPIKSSGEISPIELGAGGTNPEGISEWLLGKNDVLVGAGRGLADGGLIKALRTIDILKHYRVRGGEIRRTTSIHLDTHTESDLGRQCLSGDFSTYLRPINRISQDEFNEKQIPNWGPADTYGHTRRIPHLDR